MAALKENCLWSCSRVIGQEDGIVFVSRRCRALASVRTGAAKLHANASTIAKHLPLAFPNQSSLCPSSRSITFISPENTPILSYHFRAFIYRLEVAYEYERNWQSSGHSDHQPVWCAEDGSPASRYQIPRGDPWVWIMDWTIDKMRAVDSQGWEYAYHWGTDKKERKWSPSSHNYSGRILQTLNPMTTERRCFADQFVPLSNGSSCWSASPTPFIHLLSLPPQAVLD